MLEQFIFGQMLKQSDWLELRMLSNKFTNENEINLHQLQLFQSKLYDLGRFVKRLLHE